VSKSNTYCILYTTYCILEEKSLQETSLKEAHALKKARQAPRRKTLKPPKEAGLKKTHIK
jgi:hypothetical protein